jgi:hypothetical protein
MPDDAIADGSLADEAASFLAAYRYIEWGCVSGRFRRRTWRVQCLEDPGENVSQIRYRRGTCWQDGGGTGSVAPRASGAGPAG